MSRELIILKDGSGLSNRPVKSYADGRAEALNT